MNFDRTISPNENVACASCHMPYAGFSGPIPSVNLTMIAYPGSVHFRAGKRTAQRYTYSSYFPALQYNAIRALSLAEISGIHARPDICCRSPDAEQAQCPPVDPLEMGNPDTACIAYRLSLAPYRPSSSRYGAPAHSTSTGRPILRRSAPRRRSSVFGGSATPVQLSPEDRTRSNNDYDHWAQSLNAFEHSLSVSPFTSKFDAFLAGKYTLTADEMAGYNLFHGKGNCNSCHLDGRSTAPAPHRLRAPKTPGQQQTQRLCLPASALPILACPRIPGTAFYYETTPDFFGFTPNP